MKRLLMISLITTLMLGTSLVLFSSHWFPMWLGLELSTLSILPILKKNSKSRKKEATIKYFLVQAFSAAMLLKGATLNLWLKKKWDMKKTYLSPMCFNIILIAVMIKLGLAPCHFWFPDVLSGLSFKKGMIIACWQKMAPLFILLSISKNNAKEILILSASLSVLMGGLGGLNQMSTRKMLAYSSMSHLGWISATLFFSPQMSFAMFMFYMLNKTSLFLLCKKKKLTLISNMKKTKISPMKTCLLSILLLSLAGLPPLGGFVNKLLPLTMFMKKLNGFITPIFIMGSLMSLFFYLRITFNSTLTLFTKKSLKLMFKNTKKPKNTNSLTMSLMAPLSIWSILLIPLFYSFM